MPSSDDRARKVRRGVQVRKRGGRRRIGVVVGRHVNRLHRSDRSLLGRSDALLHLAHFGRQVRLITHRGRHAAQQRRYFRTRLRKPENVVDEQQHVLAFFIAEIFGDRQTGQSHAQTRPGRLGHLSVDQRDLRFRVVLRIDDAGLLHFEPEIVAFARSLADAGEHRNTAVLCAMLLINSMMMTVLPTPAPPNRPILPPRKIRLNQVDDLDARLEHLQFGRLLFERWRRTMDRITLLPYSPGPCCPPARRSRSARGPGSACRPAP